MTYVFEKGSAMALCGIIDGVYFDYITGKMIDNPTIISYINKGIKKKSMNLITADLKFYEVIDRNDEIFKVVAFNYCLNGSNNFLNENMQPFKKDYVEFIKSKLITNEYCQVLKWGVENE